MKKDRDCRIIRLGDRILRILDAEGEKALVIDCVKMGMPKWISLSEIEDGVEIPGEEFMGEMERDIPEGMSASARQTMQERFTVISGILPCVGDKKQRSLRIADAAEKYKVSQNTVKNYLGLYLAYQDISVLAPREKQEQRGVMCKGRQESIWGNILAQNPSDSGDADMRAAWLLSCRE